MASSKLIARRAMMLAVASAAPSVALAADPYADYGLATPNAAVWQADRGLNLQYRGPGYGFTGGMNSAFASSSQNFQSNRASQYIVFGDNPNLVAGPAPGNAAYPTWGDANNWNPATVPDGGGVATMAPLVTADGVDNTGFSTSMLLGADVNLSAINWTGTSGQDVHMWDLNRPAGSATTTINAAAGGLSLNYAGYDYEAPGGMPVMSTTYLISNIYSNIGGTGGVTVSTRASTGWSPNKTFSGGVNVVGGTFGVWAIATSAGNLEGAGTPDDSSLGSAGSLTLNNGSFQSVDIRGTTSPANFTRQINLVAGTTNNVWNNQGGTFGGVVSGGAGGTFTIGKPLFGGNQVFTANNTTTSTIHTIGNGGVVLRDNGSFAASPLVEVSGGSNGAANIIPLTLGQSDSGSADRIGDTATLRLNGAELQVQAGTAAYNEVVGQLVLGAGQDTVGLQGSASGRASLTATLSRENRGGMFIRGRDLGTGNAANAGAMFLTNGASLVVGGGGGAGTTNRSIIPFVNGVKSASATGNTFQGVGSSTFVTYDATLGIVPLDLATEYAALGAAGATDNVRIQAASAVAGGGQTVNSLLFANAGLTGTGGATVSGGTLTITSGAILNNQQGSVISAPVNFGSAEGVILCVSGGSGTNAPANGLNISGVITGTGGVTKIGQGQLYLTGANTFTGPVTINHGRLFLNSNVPAGGGTVGNPLGLGTEAVVLGSTSSGPMLTGGGQTRLLCDGASISFGRNIQVAGRGTAGALIGGFAPNTEFHMSGNLALDSSPFGPVLLGGVVEITGNVSGTGVLQDLGTAGASSIVKLSGNNSAWTGGAIINGGAANVSADIWELGSNNALGTGPVQLDGFSVVRATGGPRTISNNIYCNPASAALVMFDGPLTLSGTMHLGTGVRGGNVDGTGTLNAGYAVAAGQTVEISGAITEGGFSLVNSTLAIAGTIGNNGTLSGGGTLVLSGNNTTDNRIFVGAAGYGDEIDPNNGNALVPHIPGMAGGTLKLTNSNALGTAGSGFGSGVQVEWDGSAVALENNITLPANRNFFLRPSNGVGGAGELLNASGNNTINGNVALIPAELGNGTSSVTNTIGVSSGTLTLAGLLSDFSADTTGTGSATVVNTPGTAVLTKVGPGQVNVTRLANALFAAGSFNTSSSLASVVINAGTVAVSGARNTAANSTSNINKTSLVRSLTITGTGALDIGENDVLVDYTGGTPLATIKSKIAQGFNGGNWLGTGITSNGAKLDPNHAIGYAEATDIGSPTSYSGLPIDNTTVIVRYTWGGDDNLDGQVDTVDFNVLAAGFVVGTGDWAQGDFNYDGLIDTVDFNILASNFGKPQITGDAARGLGALVPEPTSLGLLGIAAGGLLARRRRNA
jgi:autotransporter-associated beta strand protein